MVLEWQQKMLQSMKQQSTAHSQQYKQLLNTRGMINRLASRYFAKSLLEGRTCSRKARGSVGHLLGGVSATPPASAVYDSIVNAVTECMTVKKESDLSG